MSYNPICVYVLIIAANKTWHLLKLTLVQAPFWGGKADQVSSRNLA